MMRRLLKWRNGVCSKNAICYNKRQGGVYEYIDKCGHDRRMQGKAHPKVGGWENAATRRVVREGTVALWEIH